MTSIPERSDYFSKSQDFEVTWVDDPNIEKAYLVICNPGVPCIFKEVPDNGYLKVDKSEFADFQVGTEVFFRFGRGDYHCFYQGSGADQKKICLVSMGVSNLTGFLEVVE
ncbi:MAG: hypothetical protein D6765_13060 [Bacteroidetes bacterium]|nr:MAG: hypothetical protein D6765_13060 [Bacteroidota bacterium]